MYGPFQGCTAIENVEVAQGSTNFRSNGSCLVDLMSGEVILGWGSSCVIPDYALYIGSRAFYKNDKLTSIVIPGNIYELRGDSFSFCDSLETIIISNGVQRIKDGAIFNCPALKSIIIPASVKQIERQAFPSSYSIKYYCEVDSKPSNWLCYLWEPNVVWGYKVDE